MLATSGVKPLHLSSSKKTVLLISGGPDSATLAHYLHREKSTTQHNHYVNALYLRTGEHSDDREIEAANRIVSSLNWKLEIFDIKDLVKGLGGSRLLVHSEAAIMPFGNAIALSIATAYAFQLKADGILIALHKDDADENLEYTRPFFDHFEQLVAYAHEHGPMIQTPFINMTKSEVFQFGNGLGVDYSLTWSCIRRGVVHCGYCGACRSRRRAFNLANLTDSTEYETEPVALESAVPA